MKNISLFILTPLLFGLYWFSLPFLIRPFQPLTFSILLVIAFSAIYFLLVPKAGKFGLIAWLLAIFISIPYLWMETRDKTLASKCFEFNVVYPGTEKYHQCEQSLKPGDYWATFFRI